MEVGGEEDYTGYVPFQCVFFQETQGLPSLSAKPRLNVSTILLILVNSGTIGGIPSTSSPTEVLSAFSSP